MYKLIFALSGGIGNMIQATPAIKAANMAGHVVDVFIQSKGVEGLRELFKISSINKIYINEAPKDTYDFLLKGFFLNSPLPIKFNRKIESRKRFSIHSPEALYYYDLVEQLDIKITTPNPEVNIGKNGASPKNRNTVAIYPGSKPNWAMKRWDKYDKLAEKFEHVVLVGKFEDINSHGNPTWIKKAWNWPKNTEVYFGSLVNTASVISKCKMFIGNDGGLAHIAAATGVPTFVIFGPSSVLKNKPYCDNAHAIYLGLECQPCQYREGRKFLLPGKATCPLEMACMKDMDVKFVYNKIQEKI